MTAEEYDTVNTRFLRSTCQSMSEYCRSILLGEVTTFRYRNQSLDAIFEELVSLRKELNAIGNNLNQAVHKLNAIEYPDGSLCQRLETILGDEVRPTLAKIEARIARYSEVWLQR